MKKLLFPLFALACVFSSFAMESNDTTKRVTTLNDIIAQESKSKTDVKYDQHLRKVWSHNTFFNISYNKTEISSDEFPATNQKFHNEFKNKMGVGLQWGQTFNFHKKALGNVVFFGLDYVWMDLNFNQYNQDSVPILPDGSEWKNDASIYLKNMPWHDEKMSLDYGMSIGPSLTFYPFTPFHKNAADHVRLQGYFHLGYKAEGFIIKSLKENSKDNKKESLLNWGHGMYTAFGCNLTFNTVGIGFDVRNDNINVKSVKKEYGTDKLKLKEKTTRLYIQFRF